MPALYRDCSFTGGVRTCWDRCRRYSNDPNRPEDVLKVDADEEGVGGDDLLSVLLRIV